METIAKITLDLTQTNYVYVNAMQNDGNTRALEVRLRHGGKPWQVPPTVNAAVVYCKPDRTKGMYDRLPDGRPAVEIHGSIVNVVLAQQMLTVPGKVRAGIQFHDGQLNQLTTFPFIVEVHPNCFHGAQTSEDYIRLQWLEDQLEKRLQDLKGSGVFDGNSVSLVSSDVSYQVGDSGETVPSGTWSSGIPAVPQGKYLWNRTTVQFNTGEPIVAYSVTRMGMDGKGSVFSINGVVPDSSGNVQLCAEDTDALPAAKGTPFNYLDNADFREPVAQAGIGGKHGSVVYAADRWKLTSGSVSHTAGNGLMLNGTITQRLESVPNGNVTKYISMVSGTASMTYSDGVVTITSAGGVIKWAALYQGEYSDETMPEYQPKGYAAEHYRCLRYFERIYPVNAIAASSWELYAPTVFFTPKYRNYPSAIFRAKGNNSEEGYVSQHNGSGWDLVEAVANPTGRSTLKVQLSGATTGRIIRFELDILSDLE